MAERLQAMGQDNYRNGFRLTLHPHMLELPLRWKKPQTIFVNSMSDLFHKDVPIDYIQQVFNVMRRANWHRFQVLTKRADRLADLSGDLDWAPNIWMGVSVESDKYRGRIDTLRSTAALTKFLSLEPLLGPLHGLASAISSGSSSVASQVPVPGRWTPHGRRTSATSAGGRRCRSSSSSGEARTRSRQGAPSPAAPGTRCRRRQTRSCPRSASTVGFARRGDVAMEAGAVTLLTASFSAGARC